MFTPFAFIKQEAIAGPVLTPPEVYINAVLTAGGTLSGAQETAITTFYNDLVTAGVYTKMHAIWPLLGGVANSNKIEFKAPGGSYDLTFNGTWTHSNISGSVCTPNSANYADTNLDPSNFSVTTNFSWGILGVGQAVEGYSGLRGPLAGNSQTLVLGQFGSDDVYYGASNEVTGNGSMTGPGAMQVASRNGASSWYAGYINSGGGTLQTNSASNTYTSTTANLYLGKINGTNDFLAGGGYRFAFAAEYLNTTEMQALGDAVNDLQTAFSRNIWS